MKLISFYILLVSFVQVAYCNSQVRRNYDDKKGKCPGVKLDELSLCYEKINLCSSDQDCSGDWKCCEYQCGKMCLAPEGQSFAKMLARTMPSNRYRNHGSSSYNRGRVQVRPRYRQRPYGARPRTYHIDSFYPGPIGAIPFGPGPIMNPFGYANTNRPLVNNNGMTRPLSATKSHSPISPDPLISSDKFADDLMAELIRQLSAPTQKSGTCPANMASHLNLNCIDQCSNDFGCAGQFKCCQRGCRRECTETIESQVDRLLQEQERLAKENYSMLKLSTKKQNLKPYQPEYQSQQGDALISNPIWQQPQQQQLLNNQYQHLVPKNYQQHLQQQYTPLYSQYNQLGHNTHFLGK